MRAALLLHGLPLALLAACHDGSTSEPAPPSRSGPAPLDAAPSLAEPPPTPEPAPELAPEPAPEPAPLEPARGSDRLDAVQAPEAPTRSDPACAAAEKLLAAGQQAMADGDPSLGRKHYYELIKSYPTCPQVPHVYLAFGEHFFAAGRISEAKQFYQKAAQFTDPALVAFATYKLAWCEMNETNPQAALEGFVRVVSLADRDPRVQRTLRDAAVRDSVLAYAEVGEPRKGAPYYRRVAGEAEWQAALARLAATYVERGQRDRATIVCEAAPGACN